VKTYLIHLIIDWVIEKMLSVTIHYVPLPSVRLKARSWKRKAAKAKA
jgi:hypothetical protein